MLYSYRIEQAIRAAAILHHGQVRKGGAPYPYITHPFAVASILADYTRDEDTIIAGLLHDTLEDTSYSPEELEADFGSRVREIVVGVTEDKEASSWAARKASYLRALKNAPAESFMVAAADKIHNLRAVVEEFYEEPQGYIEGFGGSLEERLLHYSRLAELFNVKLGNDIIREFNHVFSEYKRFIDHAKAAHQARIKDR
jgi:(p)ppGpp synthase/HD superfamily hydrolase